MKRILGLVVIAAALAPATAPIDAWHAASVTRGPYLQGTTSTSVSIVWRTSSPTDSVVQVDGQTFGNSSASETDHCVTVHGLAPGSSHGYRIVNGGAALTQNATLATAPSDGGFTALVFGDSGAGTSDQWKLARLMEQETFDLALHTGDVIYPAGALSGYDPYFFAPYKAILATHPIFPAIGNHDWSTASGGPYKTIFRLPANNPSGSELYYSFDWGDAHFVSIDSWKTMRTSSSALSWLTSDLAATTKRWKVVYMHVPLFSSGYHGDDSELQSKLGPILERYKVDLAIAGHDHDYERFAPIKRFSHDPSFAGVPYIVTGGGGADTRPFATHHSQTAKSEASHHYLMLDFADDAIRGRAVRPDGSTLESFTLQHN